MRYIKLILTIILLINIYTFFIYGVDKRKSIRGLWRISEKRLMFLSLLAPIGAMLGMKFFHHKTMNKKFLIGISIFLLMHVLIVIKIVLSF